MKSGNQAIEDIYELSPMQQGILFHSLYAPQSGVYTAQRICILKGKLNISAFTRAWQKVIDRHPVLRTSFHWKEVDQFLQVVHQRVNLPWKQLDWQRLSPVEQQSQLEGLLAADRTLGFELDRAPLLRLTLIQLNNDSYQFIWSSHHILFDG